MKDKSESGFTYIDVMCAIVILLVGILALVSAITGAIVQSKGQELQMDAKQIAASTIESIMAVKETTAKTTDTIQLGWQNVGNVGSNPDAGGTPQGIFVNGLLPVLPDPGVDQIIGTADDSGTPVSGFQRQIVITDQCDTERPSPAPVCATPGSFAVRIRLVAVTVTYFVGTIRRQEQMITVLTDYADAN